MGVLPEVSDMAISQTYNLCDLSDMRKSDKEGK